MAIEDELDVASDEVEPLPAIERDALAARLQRRELHELDLARGYQARLAENMLQAVAQIEPGPRKWMGTALGEVGVREVAGSQHSKRVLEYHDATILNASTDETAWCAAYTSWVLQTSKLPSLRSARALDYLAYGVAIAAPCYGAIGVLRMKGSNHVGFVVKADGTYISLLGGNQANSVCVARFPRSAFLGFRYPAGVPLPGANQSDDAAPAIPDGIPVLGADDTH